MSRSIKEKITNPLNISEKINMYGWLGACIPVFMVIDIWIGLNVTLYAIIAILLSLSVIGIIGLCYCLTVFLIYEFSDSDLFDKDEDDDD